MITKTFQNLRLSALGMGAMRLPVVDGNDAQIDEAEAARMVSLSLIHIFRSYFQNNVPLSLVEAAQIDGASEFQVVLKVVLPMSKPIIATIGLFIGVAYWNDWQNGLYYVTDEKIYSIQQILNNMLKNIEYLSKNATSVAKSTSLAGTLPAALSLIHI